MPVDSARLNRRVWTETQIAVGKRRAAAALSAAAASRASVHQYDAPTFHARAANQRHVWSSLTAVGGADRVASDSDRDGAQQQRPSASLARVPPPALRNPVRPSSAHRACPTRPSRSEAGASKRSESLGWSIWTTTPAELAAMMQSALLVKRLRRKTTQLPHSRHQKHADIASDDSTGDDSSDVDEDVPLLQLRKYCALSPLLPDTAWLRCVR